MSDRAKSSFPGWLFVLAVALFATATLVARLESQEAQADPNAPPTAQNTPKAAADPPADPRADPAADPAEAEAATKEFNDRMQEWRTLIKDLRALKIKYQTAVEPETTEIRKQFDALLVRGEEMLPQLARSARAAYVAAPNVDLQLTRFVGKMLADEIEGDRYEEALELAQVLTENNCEIKAVYDYAAVAAFVMNDYAKAKEFFDIAVEADQMTSKLGKDLQPLVESYQKMWEREAKLREAEAQADDLPRVKLTTSKGEVIIELFENEAPETVGNFVSLVEDKFYDGKLFHRVLPNFMAQGGCPIGDGTGDPGYKIYCEVFKENHRNHFRGSLSMAKGAAKDTGGSQFFLTFVPAPHLNGVHTVFGRVIEGWDVLAKLNRRDPMTEQGRKIEPDKIVTAEVIRKRDHKYEPNKVK